MNGAAKQLFSLVFIGFFSSAISYAADWPPFSITLSSPHDTWKVGSAVTVKIALTNTSDQAVLIRKSFAQDAGEVFMDVEVKDDQGNQPPRTKYYRRLRQEGGYDSEMSPDEEFLVSRSVKKIFLKPGETIEVGIVVNRLFDLDRPGKYSVRVQQRGEGAKSAVASNTITVIVFD
jgi:hypothetical protein